MTLAMSRLVPDYGKAGARVRFENALTGSLGKLRSRNLNYLTNQQYEVVMRQTFKGRLRYLGRVSQAAPSETRKESRTMAIMTV